MAAITFDTLKFVERLKAAGISDSHAKAEAEALAGAFSEALETQLATKSDIFRLERELLVLKWMGGATFGGVIALLLKAFN
ncbi:MAG: DUF1640 domain-containing protein [Rhodospirillales bacterium RIFCSPLOWO2_12_FULL_58_28]|nr:MAG: DUF1640 domain-containing protein [Rhodospirillales bacterium RIFCSPLOWO2_02_FULL_58_16]OHC79824.1 MAG: DUF1640 domain-containing protein [Rhodospirillales bacterium RIFCSPLOWO2_12_FULL_58_28]